MLPTNSKYGANVADILVCFLQILIDIKATYNDIVKNPSTKNSLKMWYLVSIKYRILIRKAENMMINDSNGLKSKGNIYPIIMNYFFNFIYAFCESTKFKMDDVLNRMYKDKLGYNLIDINSKSGRNDGYPDKITIITRVLCKPEFDDTITVPRFSITKMDIDARAYSYTIERTIYDCEKYEEYSTSDKIEYKYYKVSDDGSISNPNFVLDKTIEDEEYKKFYSMIYQIYYGMCATVTNILLGASLGRK